ncbi:MAG: polysaccharide deacetylase family protein [Desulfitobacteriaceae bacterium]
MQILVVSGRKIALLIIITVLLSLVIFVWNVQITPSFVRSGTYSMVHTEQKVVALTFDDGPDPAFTEPILVILKQKQVKATFFVIGENVYQNPSILRRIVAEGHEIGNHSYTHNYNRNKVATEIKKTDEVVYTVTGKHTHFYRPPGGYASKSQIETIKNQGYVVTLWSIDSKDWRRPGVDRIVDNVLGNISPGSIVLFHDGGGFRSQTVEALERVIDALRADGYRFVTLSELRAFESA